MPPRDPARPRSAPPIRVGLDLAPLVWLHSPGLRRLAEETQRALEAAADPRIELVPLAPPPDLSPRQWRWRALPRRAHELRLDGVHAFTSGFSLFGPGWRTHTVHELPWLQGESENSGPAHRLWAQHGWRRAARTVTASAFTLAELAKRHPRAATTARLVPWGVAEPFFTAAPDARLLEGLGLEPGFLLVPGGNRPKKRLDAVLRAAAERGDRLAVVASGPPSAHLETSHLRARELGVRLVTPGDLPDAHWPGLLAGAGAVLALARSEGFCLPVIEALASGVVPVTAAEGQAKDLAGPHGESADPEDTAELAAAIGRALEADGTARRRGREHARLYPWSRTARGLVDVWSELR
ncbi:MAG: glycosyltransferase [Planctomycetaceae bacterium]|nr:glycosyltransferase [Planctomycetaceae bacterium]